MGRDRSVESDSSRWGWTEREAPHIDGAITHRTTGDIVRVCSPGGEWDWELALRTAVACNRCTHGQGPKPCDDPMHGCGKAVFPVGWVFVAGISAIVPGFVGGVCLNLDEAYFYYHPLGVELTLLGERYWEDYEVRRAEILRSSVWDMAAARMGVRFPGDFHSCPRAADEESRECGEEEALAAEEAALAAEEEAERLIDEREDAVAERHEQAAERLMAPWEVDRAALEGLVL